MRPTINIKFINTGLDDRIVKSTSTDKPHPAKTEKLIVVQDKQKGTYMRHQEVNVPQAAQAKSHSNAKQSDSTETLDDLLKSAHEAGVKITKSYMSTSRNDDGNGKHNVHFYSHLYRYMWDTVQTIVKSAIYKTYQKFKAWDYDTVDSTLGGEDYEKDIGKTHGATYYDKYEKSLTDFEHQAIGGYTYSKWTYKLNNWLRGLKGLRKDGKPHPYPENEHEFNVVKTIANNLDTAIEKYELEKPTVVYRCMKITNLEGMLKPGNGVFMDDGFISTAVAPECFNPGGRPVLTMIVKVPAGKGHGAWLKPLSRISEENEFLLARGTQFKIDTLNIRYDKDNNPVNAIMECSVIGHKPNTLEPPTRDMDISEFEEECAKEEF